jgi:N-ethylmaleimide reductase
VDLFSPVHLGDIELANRVVMAPLTRMRSGASGVPGDLVVEHYRQRAGVGMIITEGTYPNHEGQAFVGQPGIVTDEQVEGWRRVAEAVHARGGKIVVQVMPRARSRSTARATPRRASSPTRCRTR